MSAPPADESQYIFNIVWTGDVFTHLRYFVQSIIAQSNVRFRYVTNMCTPDSAAEIEAHAAAHPDRIVEVYEASVDTMIAHGHCLDLVLDTRDDGPYFCFIDADIKADAPFMAEFIDLLGTNDAVTSGIEVWTDDNIVPPDHIGVGLGGRHFYHPDGFVYGSPHLGLYRRAAVDATRAKWGVGFGSAGNELTDEVKARLDEMGHLYMAYDTGKILNILFQECGFTFTHFDHPQLLHIGGMSHYLSPPEWDKRKGADGEPTWTTWAGMEPRTGVARFTAAMVRELAAGRGAAEIPPGLDPDMEARLVRVRAAVIDLMERYGS
ncbi:MAG: hypothetical protein HKN26_05550 [Acidimicrobiales bacterium]|nr:hypothetical protein [Acidimicrobiales bacterium]